MKDSYPFVVRPLPYEYDELMPVLDSETLMFHHDKHYKAYVDNLNAILADYPELQQMTLEELLMDLDSFPVAAQMPIRNQGGGVYNHELYFDAMKGPAGQEPIGDLAEALKRDFGSYAQWREQMKQAAMSQFGSGWAWLVTDQQGQLSILKTPNQNVPDLNLYIPIFLVDVWEHAYYLQYQNRRNDYVDGWFGLINWRKADKRYRERKMEHKL